jgi:predicted RND superfamily exporter protein
VVLRPDHGADDAAVTRVESWRPTTAAEFRGLQVEVGGQAQVFSEVGHTIERDILRAEAIAIPITMVLLVLVFGSAVAAGLPLLIGVLSILGTFLVLHLLARTTDVSVYSVNLATSLGLGLGIDYALFMVTRHREELARGLSVPAAIVATVRTAGRTVLFSALTVLLSLSALLVFPLYFLRSFAYAGIAAVVFAALGAVVVLPAALAALGPRIDRLDLRRPLRRALGLPAPKPSGLGDDGFWSRVAHGVMRRPLPVATAVIALLLVAALPFGSVVFGLPDDRVLPKEAGAFQVAQTMREDYPGRETLALNVVAPQAAGDESGYAAELSQVEGVARVDAATGTWVAGRQVSAAPAPAMRAAGGTFLRVVPEVESYGPEGEQLVRDVRAVRSPFGRGAGGGAGGEPGRHQGVAEGGHAARARAHLRDDLRAAVPVHRQPAHPGEGAGAQRAVAVRHLRRDGVGLPAGEPRRPHRGPRRHRDARHHGADPHVLPAVRAVHGLRGLPAVAHQGGVGRDGRQHPRGRRRPAAHRPDRHRGRRAARDRVPLLRQQRHQLHQAARPRDGAGDRRRRDAHPGRAGPRRSCAWPGGPTGGLLPRCAGCTTASA